MKIIEKILGIQKIECTQKAKVAYWITSFIFFISDALACNYF